MGQPLEWSQGAQPGQAPQEAQAQAEEQAEVRAEEQAEVQQDFPRRLELGTLPVLVEDPAEWYAESQLNHRICPAMHMA